MVNARSLANAWHVPPNKSVWRTRLEQCAKGADLTEFLVLQANLRGYLGAFSAGEPTVTLEASISDEEIAVGLLMPSASLDGRIFKLVLRMLQSGRLDADGLTLLARRERADVALWWLLTIAPQAERTDPLVDIERRMGAAPRGFRPPDYQYDARRLLRRRATRETGWRIPPS